MLIGYIAEIFELIGGVIIAYAVIAVHDRMREEHKIDSEVYRSMIKERRLVLFGVFLLFMGFSLGTIERIIS